MSQPSAQSSEQSRLCAASGPRPVLAGLQVLRFIAAFAVLLFHLFETYRSEGMFARNYFSIGAGGVDIFFVLSGFVIAYTAQPHRGAGYFLARRIARIVPLYWLLTIGVACVALMLPHLLNSTTFSLPNLVRSLLFIPYAKENGLVQPMLFLGWTLNYEMFFYAVFALSMLLPGWRPMYPCAAIVVIFALGLLVRPDSVLWRFYTDPLILEFALGVVLYALYDAGYVSRGRDGFVFLSRVVTAIFL